MFGFGPNREITEAWKAAEAYKSKFGKYPEVKTGKGVAKTKVATGGRPIQFDGEFYSADGLKFDKAYYERLHATGRPAPFVQAREVLSSNPIIGPDPLGKVGYLRYEGGGLEMVYNPKSGHVFHIQPLR